MIDDRSAAWLDGARVLVTGAGGQLGGYLLPALRQAGAVPVALARRPGPGRTGTVHR